MTQSTNKNAGRRELVLQAGSVESAREFLARLRADVTRLGFDEDVRAFVRGTFVTIIATEAQLDAVLELKRPIASA